MLGTIVNAISIIIGSTLGFLIFKGRLNEKTNESIVKGSSLAILIIGMKYALAGENMMLMIISIVIGTFIGESIHIEDRMEQLGKAIESKFKGDNNVAKAFVTSSLLYCTGSMAILGALEGGLKGEHHILYAKSVLDGIISIMFTSTMGIGVVFSAVPVLIYQGAIVIGAGLLKSLLTDPVIANMNGIGGLLIIALSLNLLEVKHIRVGNMLPAVFIPVIYEIILKFIV
jgi:uncharacterized protein